MRKLLILTLLLFASPAWGALALNGTPVSNHNTSGTSGQVTFSTSEAGVVYVFALINGFDVSSISDTAGLTYTRRVYQASPNIELWTAYTASALSSDVITVTFSNNSTFWTVGAFSVSGVPSSSYFDVNGSLPASGASDPLSISTTAADTFIVGATRFAGTASPTEGTGFTKIYGADYMLIEYKIVSAPQSSLSVAIGTGAGDGNGALADAVVMATAGGAAVRRKAIVY